MAFIPYSKRPHWDGNEFGRPPLPPHKRRSRAIGVRFTDEQIRGLDLLARDRKISVTRLIAESALYFLSHDLQHVLKEAHAVEEPHTTEPAPPPKPASAESRVVRKQVCQFGHPPHLCWCFDD